MNELLSTKSLIKRIKEQGIIINDEKKAIDILENEISYFHLLSYRDLFHKDKHGIYHNLYFQDFIDLYNFEHEILNVFFQMTLDIETCIKTRITNFFSHNREESILMVNYFKTHNREARNLNQYDRNYLHYKMNSKYDIKSILSKEVEDEVENEEESNTIPVYVYPEIWSFATLIDFIQFFKSNEEKNDPFGEVDNIIPKRDVSILFGVKSIRNASAHNMKFVNNLDLTIKNIRDENYKFGYSKELEKYIFHLVEKHENKKYSQKTEKDYLNSLNKPVFHDSYSVVYMYKKYISNYHKTLHRLKDVLDKYNNIFSESKHYKNDHSLVRLYISSLKRLVEFSIK